MIKLIYYEFRKLTYQKIFLLFFALLLVLNGVFTYREITPRKIQNEKDMIDNVRGIVMKSKTNDTKKNNNMTVLEAFDLKVRKITYDEEDKIINSLGYDYNGTKVENRYLRAFAIENTKTQKAFEQYVEINGIKKDQIIQSFHGSKVENWASILKQGLSLNPNDENLQFVIGGKDISIEEIVEIIRGNKKIESEE